jgi:penicillin amidase
MPRFTIAEVRRLLIGINILIAIAIVAAAVGYYWYFVRPLPQTSGEIRTLVSQPVEVVRDGLAAPHIRAQSIEDAFYVQGYVTAEDRMFQMDALRRLSAGELSEVVGPAALESDLESRRLRLRRLAEEIYTRLPAAEHAHMAAYARGVNAYIESHRGRYGFEFEALGYDPRAWSQVDSILIGLHMFRTLTSDWRSKLMKEQMLRSGEPDKVKYLFSYRSGAEFMPGGDSKPGSNAWAISGPHTWNGKPMLSNDTHLEFSIPGIWFMTQLSAPGLNVEGFALPGVPGIVIGHNDRIAWGVTNLGFDVQDLYIEKIDTRTGQYQFAGHTEQARAEREIIPVKGEAPHELLNWVTRHGPIFISGKGPRNLSLRWTAADPGVFDFVFVDVDRARNWQDFTNAISRFGGPGQNFVYADVDGNIGYHATGKLPIRKNFLGDVPVDGSSGEYEWDGFIPFDDLPHAFNPKDGFVVTANQNPFPADYPYHVSGNFASPYRSRQIFNMLAKTGTKLRPEDGVRVEKDVYSGYDQFLAKRTVKAYAGRTNANKSMGAAVDLLKTWDGQMDKEHPEPLITELTSNYIKKAAAERASPGSGGIYRYQLSSAIVQRMLTEQPKDWFQDYDQMVLQAFADAMEEGSRMQGADPKGWKWGRYSYLSVRSPVGSHLPVVGKYFDIGPIPMSGGPVTVKQTNGALGPSERMDAALGDWDSSLWELPIGQSGHFASSHYKDQFDAYYNGHAFPMQFGKVEAKSTVRFVPQK